MRQVRETAHTRYFMFNWWNKGGRFVPILPQAPCCPSGSAQSSPHGDPTSSAALAHSSSLLNPPPKAATSQCYHSLPLSHFQYPPHSSLHLKRKSNTAPKEE